MSVSLTHLLQQGPVLHSLARAALSAFSGSRKSGEPPPTPGPEFQATVASRPPALIRDYIRHVGGDPGAYRQQLPPHFFPQWGFPLLARTVNDLPYDLSRMLNGGCRLEIRSPLPADEPLHLKANLQNLDDNGQRVILTERLLCGTDSAPQALLAEINALIPLKRDKNKPKKEKPRIPHKARPLARWFIPASSGLDFALLTGDFNPVHWLPPYARMAGFAHTIAHGFATMARAIEGLNHSLFAGNPYRLQTIEVRFVRPLVLPARTGLFLHSPHHHLVSAPSPPTPRPPHATTNQHHTTEANDNAPDSHSPAKSPATEDNPPAHNITGGDIFVGPAPGGPACLTGSFTMRSAD